MSNLATRMSLVIISRIRSRFSDISIHLRMCQLISKSDRFVFIALFGLANGIIFIEHFIK